jgi:hypothetical protein
VVGPVPQSEISRWDTPSLASALVSAHSNALTTSRPPLVGQPDETETRLVATELAHFSIPRSGALLAAKATTVTEL